MNEMPELVVIRKQSLLKENTGIVKILFTQDITGKASSPDINLFPTKTVWISRGYLDIEENFKEGELFVIDQYNKTDDSEAYETTRPDTRSEHWATGSTAKRLDPSRYLPVVLADLPDKGTGILLYNERLPQGNFFILNKEYLYGPFTASSTEDEIQATPAQCMPLNLSSGDIAQLPIEELKKSNVFLTLEDDFSMGTIGYITSLKDISRVINLNEIEKIDYINDSQLINYFTKNGFGAGGKSALGRKPAEQLKNAISQQAKRNLMASGNERIERLSKIIDQYLSQPDPGHEIINNWLSSGNGKSFLKELAYENPGIFESHTKDLDTRRENLEEVIARLESEKRKLENDIQAEKSKILQARNEAELAIEDIRKQTVQEQQKERQKVMADLEDKIQESENKLIKTKEDLKVEMAHLSSVRDLSKLKGEIKYQERRNDELKESVKAQEILLKNPDLSKEVLKTQTLLDLIHGRRFNREDTAFTYTSSKLASSEASDGNSIVQAMSDYFEEGGRSFTFEEMANLLITIQQSFMTVLKGLPGAGKTSTAIRLAQAYHIANENGLGDDFLNVPISRGWVSGRDFIGFYNSLKGCYQPARTGMYQFLVNGASEGAEKPLRLVLLDEANLSPMEHYLSDFLGMFDMEGRSRPIDTGNPIEEQRFLNVPLNTRFIATINNDNTTEPLSPRLCDRVPIISMDLKEPDSNHVQAAFNLDGVIPYSSLENIFGVKSADKDIDTYYDLPVKLASVLPIFEERNKDLGQITIISKRKRMAMQAYYAVARRYMDETKAADFALSQYVLPLVSGFGKPYKNRLERVADYAERNNLSRSIDILEEVVDSGDAHVGSYSFF